MREKPTWNSVLYKVDSELPVTESSHNSLVAWQGFEEVERTKTHHWVGVVGVACAGCDAGAVAPIDSFLQYQRLRPIVRFSRAKTFRIIVSDEVWWVTKLYLQSVLLILSVLLLLQLLLSVLGGNIVKKTHRSLRRRALLILRRCMTCSDSSSDLFQLRIYSKYLQPLYSAARAR